jgi:hypothetical protein
MMVIKAVQTKGYGYGMYSEHTIGTDCFQNIRVFLIKVAETTVFVTCITGGTWVECWRRHRPSCLSVLVVILRSSR